MCGKTRATRLCLFIVFIFGSVFCHCWPLIVCLIALRSWYQYTQLGNRHLPSTIGAGTFAFCHRSIEAAHSTNTSWHTEIYWTTNLHYWEHAIESLYPIAA